MTTKIGLLLSAALLLTGFRATAQVDLPRPATNLKCMAGRQVALTDIEIRWSAPGVKGREGKIWGTDIAWYGYQVLGYGSVSQSPWRAGADECTTISFSTDVTINDKPLAAGKYGLFMLLSQDSTVLIFSKNSSAWGSYFYNPAQDVLRVSTRQQKDLPQSVERLQYSFSEHTDSTVNIALEWEYWRIPFTVKVDLLKTALASLQAQMSTGKGFEPASLQMAAQWCLSKQVNTEQALQWIESAVDPNLGGQKTFSALSVKAGLLRLNGKNDEADKVMAVALENASVMELHVYGRQLLAQKKNKEALAVFEKNRLKNGDQWPVNVGLARGYSANGDLKKALECAKAALKQAPDEVNKKSLEGMIKSLSEGKAL